MARNLTGEKGRLFPIPNEGQAPPEFGGRANVIETIRLPLDGARTAEEIKVGGTILWCYEASSGSAEAQISFSDRQGRGVLFRDGVAIRGVEFSSIFVTNTAQAGEYLELMYATEAARNINIENAGAVFTSVTVSKATTLTTQADVSVGTSSSAQILAANAARREAIIKNLSTNAAAIRVGDSNVAATRGVPLQPGESATLQVTTAIHAYNTSGSSAADVAGLEIAD